MVQAASTSATRDGSIGEHENCSHGVKVLLDLSSNTLSVELVLLNVAGVDESRCIEEANLEKWLFLLTTLQ